MKKYPEPPPENEWRLNEEAASAHLELPVDPDFLSLPPRIDPQAMLRRIEENLPWRSTRPGEKERRFAEKVGEEFVL
ncbi:MAG: hypothetical protein DME22_22290 [Verrucomicrobia bacterium]|nr:MAG: hypothetical protein DME22_22290 [Verrucomicrobiota bacterium]PYJ98097.1 MAG: hypothetical protein DME23_13040 [Verrucomicrobiota bacterium]